MGVRRRTQSLLLIPLFLAVVGVSPTSAVRPKCMDFSCPQNLHSLLTGSSKNCRICDDCTAQGYSVCITDQQNVPPGKRRTRRSDDRSMCICTTHFPEGCDLDAKEENPDAKFSGRACYRFAHKPLPAPSSKIISSGVVVTFDGFIDDFESYWKEFNITGYHLQYEFPIAKQAICKSEGKIKFPSIDELTRLAGSKMTHMCNISRNLNDDDDMELVDAGLKDDGVLGEVLIPRDEFDAAEFTKFKFEISVDQPRQMQLIGKFGSKKMHIYSDIIEQKLNWESAEDDDLDYGSEEAVEGLEEDDVRRPVTVVVEPSSSAGSTQTKPTKVPITEREEEEEPTTSTTTTTTSTEVPSSTTTQQSEGEVLEHHGAEPEHHHHGHHHHGQPKLPAIEEQQEENDAEEAQEGAKTAEAPSADENLALYILALVIALVLVVIAVAVCCCKKRCRKGGEAGHHTNGQSKSVDGKRYHKAPV